MSWNANVTLLHTILWFPEHTHDALKCNVSQLWNGIAYLEIHEMNDCNMKIYEQSKQK